MTDESEKLRLELLKLLRKRDVIDNLIKTYGEVLEAELGSTEAGLQLNLVDPEGYPLKNVDHVSVTSSRQQIAILTNDRKELSKSMEEM